MDRTNRSHCKKCWRETPSAVSIWRNQTAEVTEYVVSNQVGLYRSKWWSCKIFPTVSVIHVRKILPHSSSISEKSFPLSCPSSMLENPIVHHPCRKNPLVRTFLCHIIGIETLRKKIFEALSAFRFNKFLREVHIVNHRSRIHVYLSTYKLRPRKVD